MAHALFTLDNLGYKHTLRIHMYHLLLFHCNNGCTNTPQCYVTRTLPVLLVLVTISVTVASILSQLQRNRKLRGFPLIESYLDLWKDGMTESVEKRVNVIAAQH